MQSLVTRTRVAAVALVAVVSIDRGGRRASADDATGPNDPPAGTAPAGTPATPGPRDPGATFATMFHGPFQSSRLFSMPTADVIGAYMLSLSGDGSLLQQPGVLTSAGVFAIGFGDIAQLEYRHTAAISVTGVDAPVPAVGVQFKVPIPETPNVPAFGLAVRIGVPRTEQFGATQVEEKVTDFYFVTRERFAAVPWLTLHGGLRVSPATLTLTGDPALPSDPPHKRTLYLPTSGLEVEMNKDARLVGEVAAVPQFKWMAAGAEPPSIGYGLLARLGLRWRLLPSVVFDGSLGYQLEAADARPGDGPRDIVQQWDIRLGAEVFVPWGALACRAVGVFCD
jgi:hypothetical protein